MDWECAHMQLIESITWSRDHYVDLVYLEHEDMTGVLACDLFYLCR